MAEYSAGTAKIEIRPNLKDFGKRAKAELEQIKITYGVDIEPELERFRAELDAELANLESAQIEVDADTTQARAELAAVGRDQRATIEVDADTAAAQAKIDAVDNDRTLTLEADADTAAAQAQLSAAARDRTVELEAKVDTGSLASASSEIAAVGTTAQAASGSVGMLGAQAAGIGILGVAAMGAVGPLAALASTAVTASGALLVLPSAAAAATAGIAALGIGLSGITKAFSSMGQSAGGAGADTSKAMKAAQRGVEDAQRGIVQAQRRVEDAERAVADAQKASQKAQDDLNRARRDAVDDLRDMNQQLRDAAMDEEEATLAVARARQNLIDTQQDPKSSALDQAEADLAYRKAVKNLEDTREKNNELARDVDAANRAGVEGSDKVVSAKEKVEQATRREEDAQRSLADANESVALAQERLADAMDNLASAGAGAAGGVDAFAEAMANLSPNAQEFVLAMQALGPAWEDLRFAVQDNLFEGLGQSVTDLANVQLPVLQSGLSGIASEINGGFRDSLSALGSQASVVDMGSMLENSRLGFAGLNQAAAPVTQALMDIGAAGSEYLPQLGQYLGDAGERFGNFLSQSTQNGQFDQWVSNGISAMQTLGDMASSAGGIISGVFGAAAASGQSSIGPMAQVLSMMDQFVNSAQGQEALQGFFSSMSSALSALMPILSTALQSIGSTILPAISEFIQAAAPGTEALIQGLADGLSALAPAMAPLGEAIGAVFGAIAPLLEPIGALLTAVITPAAQGISSLAGALAPVISMLAAQLMPVIAQLAPVLSQTVGILTNGLVQVISAITPFLPMIVQAIGQVLQAIIPLLPLLAQLVVNIITPLLPAVVALIPAIISVVQVFAQIVVAVMPVITVLGQLIGIVAQVLATVIGFVATVIGQFLSLVAGIIAAVGNIVSGVVGGFNGLIGTVVSAVLNFVSDVINRFNELWSGASQAFSSGIDTVLRITSEIQSKILKVFDGAGDWLKDIGRSIMSGLHQGMKDKWEDVKNFFSNAIGSIRNPFSKHAEGSYTANAMGSIKRFAGGGENHEPQFAPAGSWRVFGEDETGGELYIPLADDYRRSRAEALLVAGAHHFGLEVIDPATGQLFSSRYQGDLGPQSASFFAEGGVTIKDLDDFASGVDGQPYALGGPYWGDCSQTVSIVTRYGKFGEKLMQRAFSTVNEGQVLINEWDFYPGLGDPGDLQVGWWDQGGGVNGHTAMTLPSGTNVEMGGSPSQGHFGGSGVGAADSQFTVHAHLPRSFFEPITIPDMGDLGDFPTDLSPETQASAQSLQTYRASQASDPNAYVNTAGSNSPKTISEFAGSVAKDFAEGQTKDFLGVIGISDDIPLVKAYTTWMEAQSKVGSGSSRASAVNDIQTVKSGAAAAIAADPTIPTTTVTGADVVGFNDGFDDIPAPQVQGNIGQVWDPSGGAEQWRGLATEALNRHGYSSAAEIDATVQQIDIESSGNPNAQNDWDVNAANGDPSGGLLQVIQGTYDWMRQLYPEAFDGTPWDKMDPLSNLIAGVAWARHQYGGPLNVWPTRAGYWAGGSVVGPGGPTEDIIPALLSNGEFVVREAAARYARPLLERINADPGFARSMASSAAAPLPDMQPSKSVEVHYHIETNSLDEGMRRAELHSRQQVIAMSGA
ncbi:tape measure protein [Corynebacterium phage Colleen]|uniref:Minor tail protein Gp26 n=4 Tax=root TaxID=1 RepID=W5XXC2_9CORY|nr:hypothetical protein [Corynebacterium vitaeruminis]YP_009626529.1 tail length tape measure protein [Corynebacterium phage Poushou]AWY06465.1 tape measure protein [Corynebacterium phage TouchMeNot]QFG14766.1 tape measure protein [Corynebacterium phage Colleen]UVT31903.1 tape measure protein [Corynebacterium phage Arianna]AHI21607.1 minor tail protein Gp26 [Corynebacterium vitaeruminis DSM 20294]ASJ78976.1 tape measure protein [Corynebacterium phage Poushou]